MSCGKCNTCGKWMEPCPRCKGKGIYDGYSCKHCRGIGCICPKHGGYTGSGGGGCFITTATLLATGKDDNCDELNTFRTFRDNWIGRRKNGGADIEEYYLLAPKIISVIDYQSNALDIYLSIWENDLFPCYQLIHLGQYAEAEQRYREMISRLKTKYLDISK